MCVHRAAPYNNINHNAVSLRLSPTPAHCTDAILLAHRTPTNTTMDSHSSVLAAKSNRNLDHLYCHPNESNHRSSGTASTADMVSVLKEIKQLKAMLLLHLDLIQEQSDQLMSKDKMLASLRKENEILRARVERFDRRNSNAAPPPPPPPTAPVLVPNKHYQPVATTNNTNINNNNKCKDVLPTVRASVAVNVVVPPAATFTSTTVDENNCEMPEIKAKCDILKKISAKLLNNLKLTSLSETIESKYKICDFDDQDRQVLSLRVVSQPSTTPTSSVANNFTTAATSASNAKTTTTTTKPTASSTLLAETQTSKSPTYDGRNSIIGEYEGKYINKIILQRIPAHDKDSNYMKIKTEFENEDDDDDINEIIDYVTDMNSAANLSTTPSPTESFQKAETLPSIISDAGELIDIGNYLVNEQPNGIMDSKSPVLTTIAEVKSESRRRHLRDDTETTTVASRKRRRCDRTLALVSSQNTSESNDRFQTSTVTDQSGNFPPAMLLEDDETFAETMSASTKHTYPPRRAFMQTQQLYMTREWKMDEIEVEVNKQITDMGGDERVTSFNEVVNLEVPRWTVKECTGLYSIEGTEDLSDDTFLKRHARLELDEKKRKKWDVQRIREQRTIERLKRRHCKKEDLENSQKDAEDLGTFYPLAENIKFIQVTEDLPVQAFGEAIPLLNGSDFTLPWMQHHRAVSSDLSTSLSSLSHHPVTALASLPATTKADRPMLLHQQQGHTTITFANKKKCVRRHYTNSASSSTTTPSRPRCSRRSKR